jgi:D-glycero-alpha-D-manno-heptose 1-phosphate guanylyltransferase
MNYPIAVLAGGLGTRLGTLTRNKPKVLVEVCGRPFLYWKLKQLEKQGFKKIILCTGYKDRMIRKYISSDHFNLDIFFSNDGKNLVGTGGAIKRSIEKLGSRFYVTYGDSYLQFNPTSFEDKFSGIEHGSYLTYHRNLENKQNNNLLVDDEEILSIKSSISNRVNTNAIDYGLLAFTKSEFEPFNGTNPFSLHDVIDMSIKNGVAFGYEVKDNFIDMGTPDGLASLRNLIGEELKWNL